MYDRTTVQGATFNMRGQLYRGHANATTLFSSPVVSALGSEYINSKYFLVWLLFFVDLCS